MNDIVNSRIWKEVPEPDNPFAAAACYCRGYDVYGDLLGKATYIEYLYLLFNGERPSAQTARALEILAVAIANPGPRDPSVHAAMCAGVGGSTAASALMAALAAGAGSYCGSRDVLLGMELWASCGTDIDAWRAHATAGHTPERATVWPESGHVPGFDPHGEGCTLPVRQTLDRLSAAMPHGRLAWLAVHRAELEAFADCPLALSGVAAALFADLDFSPQQGEMLTLLLRLPGAAAHALEQWEVGFRHFPFFNIDLQDDPGPTDNQEASS